MESNQKYSIQEMKNIELLTKKYVSKIQENLSDINGIRIEVEYYFDELQQPLRDPVPAVLTISSKKHKENEISFVFALVKSENDKMSLCFYRNDGFDNYFICADEYAENFLITDENILNICCDIRIAIEHCQKYELYAGNDLIEEGSCDRVLKSENDVKAFVKYNCGIDCFSCYSELKASQNKKIEFLQDGFTRKGKIDYRGVLTAKKQHPTKIKIISFLGNRDFEIFLNAF